MIPSPQIFEQYLKSGSEQNLLDFTSPDLNKASSSAVQAIYKSTLFDPLTEFLSRPKKGFRFELIRMGWAIAAELIPHEGESEGGALSLFNDVVELLHSGSLIVDDIEDQTKMRRGRETLHEMYGVPVALNAGNWLYFWPLMMIQSSSLPLVLKERALFECHRTLLLAHTGQALDLGTPISQLSPQEVMEVVHRSIELKSGALAALAMQLGVLSHLQDCPVEVFDPALNGSMDAIKDFGLRMGQLLQFYDDIGNLTSPGNPQKQYEDLLRQRPSFIWAVAAEALTPSHYQSFLAQVTTAKQISELEPVVARWGIKDLSRAKADQFRQRWVNEFSERLPTLSLSLQQGIQEKLERLAYAY